VLLSIAATVHLSGLTPFVSAVAAVALAAVWQCSPAKQVCLNHCHVRPALAAFGPRADTDVITFGATHAGWCIGSCGAAMLVPLILPGGHIAAMIALSVLVFCERLDRPAPPAWQWRGHGTAWRLVSGRVRMQLRAGE
jgi:predicted metal-binding membrane protein